MLVLAVLVAGCGPAVRYAYTRPGVRADQRSRDETDCREVAMVTEPLEAGYGWMSRWFERDRFNRCMADRGYVVHETRQ
jgi:hypothetical protein